MQKNSGRSIYLSKKTLLAFVGLPASGKSTAIEAVRELGPTITMGDVIREETSRQKLDPSPENIGKIAQTIRVEYGDDVIAKRCIEKIKNLKESVILIDGIRSMIEVKRFREHWSLFIIAIICSDELRFQRIKARGRSDDTINMAKIEERDTREAEFGLEDVISKADYTVYNTKDANYLVTQVRNLVLGEILS